MNLSGPNNTNHFKRSLVVTEDGSHTLYIPVLDEHYHSVHGAIQESEHVFIRNGLNVLNEFPEIKILEIGFGTGLNALLTYRQALLVKQKVVYHAIEKYPLQPAEYEKLNYFQESDPTLKSKLLDMHQGSWESEFSIDQHFSLLKRKTDLTQTVFEGNYHLIYFDAFAPDKQPDLWEFKIFEKLAKAITPGGILVTYSAKGQVRRNLISAGFVVERLPGPPGKREMLRAQIPD